MHNRGVRAVFPSPTSSLQCRPVWRLKVLIARGFLSAGLVDVLPGVFKSVGATT